MPPLQAASSGGTRQEGGAKRAHEGSEKRRMHRAVEGRCDLQQRPEEKKAAAGRISLKVRSFSTSVTRPAGRLVRPPILVYGLEGRYATALYSAAFKEKKLDQVEKDLTRVLALVKDPKLSFIITNPM